MFILEKPKSFELMPDNTIGIFTVTDMHITQADGGVDQYKLSLRIDDKDGNKIGNASDKLTHAENMRWKVADFMACTNAVEQYGLKEGDAFELSQGRASHKRVPWVDPVGLRGWCKITVFTKPNSKDGSPMKFNNVKYLTDHGMVPRVASEFED